MTTYAEDVRPALAEVAPHLANRLVPTMIDTVASPYRPTEAEARVIYRAAMLVWGRRGWAFCCFECWNDQAAPRTTEQVQGIRANGCRHAGLQ